MAMEHSVGQKNQRDPQRRGVRYGKEAASSQGDVQAESSHVHRNDESGINSNKEKHDDLKLGSQAGV